MWTLNPTESREKKYLNILFDKVKSRAAKYDLNNYLSECLIKKILLVKPCSVKTLEDELNQKLKNVPDKNKLLTEIFNYKTLIVNNKKASFAIAKLIGVNTCVYCNRQYIFTVTKGKKGIVRPEFDHYLPKSIYPFLALSLYNLIPSCHICNSNCKGREELPENFNPYLNKDTFFKFSYIPDGQGIPKKIKIKDINPKYKTEIKKFLAVFKLKEIYDYHIPLEVNEIYTFATKYSDAYLQQLLNQLGKNFNLSQEEAYRMLFGTELLESKDNDRPLSKLKRDILIELGVISPNKP